jgi:predicted Zn-dependent protease
MAGKVLQRRDSKVPATGPAVCVQRCHWQSAAANRPALFAERALKEAVHELGYTFGLGHCGNPRCVM